MINSLWLMIFWLLWVPVQEFDWVSFTMIKRSTARGMSTRVDARVHFSYDGDMVTYFTNPSEMFVLNNREGEIHFYDPVKNTVFVSYNNAFGSQSTTFYYFLVENDGDMGLRDIGFKLKSSQIEDGMLVSIWNPPPGMNKQFDHIEVVSDGDRVIFMGYKTDKGAYLKKIFYYDFQRVGLSDFPFSITEIDYVESDSVVSKTTFSQFEFDNPADKELVEFKIPEDAKLLE